MSEIAKIESLTRTRVTQIMTLLKLPAEMQEFLWGWMIKGRFEDILRGSFVIAFLIFS